MNDNYSGGGPNTAHQPPPNRDMSYHEDYQNGNNYYGHPNRSMNGNGNSNDDNNGNGSDMNGDKNNRQRKRSSDSRSISRSRSRSRSVSSRRNNRKSHHNRSRSRSRSVSRSPRSKGRERRDRRRSRSRSTSRSRYRHRRSRNRRSESRSRSPVSRKGGRRRNGGRSMSPSRSRSRDRRSRSPRRGRNQNSPHRRSFSRERSRSFGRGGNFGQPPYGMDDDNHRRGPPMMHRGDPLHHGYHERSPYGPGVQYGGGGGGGYGNYGHPPQSHGPAPTSGGGGGGGRDRRRGRRGGQEGVSLLVRNLSADITTHDLEHAFRRIGAVRDVYIPTDYHSRQPKGFAFVEYATQEEATEAKNEMNRFLIKGRHLEVLFAQEKRKTPGEMKGRSDGDEGGNGGRVRSSSFERHMERERRGMMRSGPPR